MVEFIVRKNPIMMESCQCKSLPLGIKHAHQTTLAMTRANSFQLWSPMFSSLAYLFIENIGAERVEDDTSFRAWVMGKLYHSFITLTGNYSYEPKTLGGRFYGVVFVTWAMIITGK